MKYNAEMNELYESYLLKISQGCHNSLELLYEKTKSYVYRYALSMVKNITDAEDIMQDTYVNIYKYAHMYNPRKRPLAWILTITRNLCLNRLKKKKVKEIDIHEIEQVLSNNRKDEHHNYILLNIILSELTEEESKIIVLSSIEGLKYREIAELLDLNISTILSKYHRAIKKIRSKYKEV